MLGRLLSTIILCVFAFGMIGNANATYLIGSPTDFGDATTVGSVDSEGEIEFYVPLDGPDGTYGVDDGGLYGTVPDSTGVPIDGPLMSMYLYFDIPDDSIGYTLKLRFTDLDLIPYNDPDEFYEKFSLYGEGGLPVGTFTSFNELSSYVISADKYGSLLTFTNLYLEPGESWIQLGFEAYSGDDIKDGWWKNTAEYLTAKLYIKPVPEPATVLLLGSSFILLIGLGRKKS